MNIIGIIINDAIAACAGAAIATAIIGITIFRTRLKRASARENMTISQRWKHDLKCWIDGLENKQLDRVIDAVHYDLDIPSICERCRRENGGCRVSGNYECPFTTKKGIDDYMNARIGDWSFRGYIGVYLSKQRAKDYCNELRRFGQEAQKLTVTANDIQKVLK